MGLQHVGKRTILFCWSTTHAITVPQPLTCQTQVCENVRHTEPKQQYPEERLPKVSKQSHIHFWYCVTIHRQTHAGP